jgi:hypothetical protein
MKRFIECRICARSNLVVVRVHRAHVRDLSFDVRVVCWFFRALEWHPACVRENHIPALYRHVEQTLRSKVVRSARMTITACEARLSQPLPSHGADTGDNIRMLRVSMSNGSRLAPGHVRAHRFDAFIFSTGLDIVSPEAGEPRLQRPDRDLKLGVCRGALLVRRLSLKLRDAGEQVSSFHVVAPACGASPVFEYGI